MEDNPKLHLYGDNSVDSLGDEKATQGIMDLINDKVVVIIVDEDRVLDDL